MSASDYIYEKVPGPRPTDEEVAAVLDWCRVWAEDSFEKEEIPFNDVALLRGCETHIDGGLAFVLADVRRIAEHDAGMAGANFEQAARLRELFVLIVQASSSARFVSLRNDTTQQAYRNGLMDAYVLLSGHDAEHVYEIVQNVLQARAEGAEMLAPRTLDPRD